MKLFAKLCFVLLLLGGVISVSNADSTSSRHPSSVQIDPVLGGTFVDFWNKGNWSAAQWDAFVKEIKSTGMKTLIVQFASYENYTWFYSPTYAGSSENYINALPRLLYAASINGLDVYVGIYFSEAYWNNTLNESWLNAQAQKNITMASEIWGQYGGYTAFKGWYISYEPAPTYYNSASKINILKDKLINPIADKCKKISHKPVAIAAFVNQNNTSADDMIPFMKNLSSAHLDIIMLQDGVGVNHVSMDNLESYYNEAEWGLYGEGSFHGEFWADTEIFDTSNNPAPFCRVEEQLETESWYVDKIVSFKYYEYMHPQGPNTWKAEELREDYLDYYYDH